MSTPLFAQPLSEIQPVPLRWLWEPYLLRGKLAILDGDPGIGKSLLTLDVAARLSRGGPLPDGTSAGQPHVTLFLSGEDSAADTLRPRAEANGADLSQLHVVASADGILPRFPADVPSLEQVIRERHADLVVIDPVMAFLPPEVASNTDQCVRGALNVLAALALRTDCAILLIRHLRKAAAVSGLHRGLGSIGIIGAVRSGLLAAPHPTQPGLRVFAANKVNLASTPTALGYRLGTGPLGQAAVEWTGPLNVSADALGLPRSGPLQPRDRAAEWLVEQLASGPRRVIDLIAAAAQIGIPSRTLERAKTEINARAQQVAIKNDARVWYWYDPSADWPKNAPFPRPFELLPFDPLR